MTVRGSARGEDQSVHAGIGHGSQEGLDPPDVLAVVVERTLHGLTRLLLRRHMDDAHDGMFTQKRGHPVGRVHRVTNERNVRQAGEARGTAGGEVVENDDRLASRMQGVDDVCTDETGATGDEPGHGDSA